MPELDGTYGSHACTCCTRRVKDRKTLPSSYTLQHGPLNAGAIRSYGGFTDVSTGGYLGRQVAIKLLRFWAQHVSNKVSKVLESSPTLYFTAIHLENSGFFRKSLSRGAIRDPTSYRCREFRSLQTAALSSWFLLGCKTRMRWNTTGPTLVKIVWSW